MILKSWSILIQIRYCFLGFHVKKEKVSCQRHLAGTFEIIARIAVNFRFSFASESTVWRQLFTCKCVCVYTRKLNRR